MAMPGGAKTSQFQFAMATVMVAPMASQLSINSTAHSIGLVKNVMVEADPTTVDLTMGLQNDIVFSAINKMDYKVIAEVYEFTAENRAYGLTLDADPNAATNCFALRIVGTTIADKRPIALHFPKVRILKGFSTLLSSDDFGNLPFEFTPYTPLATDPGYCADFKQRMTVFVP